MRTSLFILSGVSSMLAATAREAVALGLHVAISIKGFPVYLNNPFLNSGVRGMLKRKGYRAVDMVVIGILYRLCKRISR